MYFNQFGVMCYSWIHPWCPYYGYLLSSFKVLFSFIIPFVTYVPVVMVYGSISLSKWRIAIIFPNCIRISTSLDSLCWKVSTAGSFTYINTYVACSFSFFFFFFGNFTRANTTSRSVPCNFVGLPVSGIPPNIWFLVMMVIFTCVLFYTLIFFLL